jgi:hypothetical protein
MEPRLNKVNTRFADKIYQPMFLRNPARPSAGRKIFQWFWLPAAAKRVTHDRFDEVEDADQGFAVGTGPMTQILSEIGVEYRVTLISSCGQSRTPRATRLAMMVFQSVFVLKPVAA